MLTNPSHIEEKAIGEVELTVEKLTKREYFAALALQSIMKSSTWIDFSSQGIITDKTFKVADENSKTIADICVKYADALLARLGED